MFLSQQLLGQWRVELLLVLELPNQENTAKL